MRYKVIYPGHPDPIERSKSLVLFYHQYVTSRDRERLATEIFEKIKTDRNFPYTFHTVFFLLNSRLIKEDNGKEFLQLLQNNAHLRIAILETLEDDHPGEVGQLQELQLTEPLTEIEFQLLPELLDKERASAMAKLDEWFYNHFKDFYQHCPKLFYALSNKVLKELIIHNPEAVDLLNDKILANLYGRIIELEELYQILSLKASPEIQKKNAATVLAFCLKEKKDLLAKFFTTIKNRTAEDSLGFKRIDAIKNLLMSLGADLLKFFQQNPELFTSYFGKPKDLEVLLKQWPNVMTYLTNLIKNPQIASWVSSNIIGITALLYRNKIVKKEDIKYFLTKYPDRKQPFITTLTESIHDTIPKLKQSSAQMVTDVSTLLHNTELGLVNIQSDLESYMQNPELCSVIDRLFIINQGCWDFFSNQLVKRVDASKDQFPLLDARRMVARKTALASSLKELEATLTTLQMYVLIVSNEWQNVKKFFQNPVGIEAASHPLLRLRLRLFNVDDPEKLNKEIVSFLLSDEGKKCFEGNYEIVDLLLLLATGEEIIEAIAVLLNYKKQLADQKKVRELLLLTNSLDYLVNCLIRNRFVNSKFKAAVTAENLLIIIDLYRSKEMLRQLDPRIFISALQPLDLEHRLMIIENLIDSQFAIELFVSSNKLGYCYLLIELLNNQTLKCLLSKLQREEIIYLLNVISFGMAVFLFENECNDYPLVGGGFDSIDFFRSFVLENLQEFTNPNLLNYFKECRWLVDTISYEQFSNLMHSYASSELILMMLESKKDFLARLCGDKDILLHILLRNLTFGNWFFENWHSQYYTAFQPEYFFNELFRPENKKILRAYLNEKIPAFLGIVKNILNNIEPELRAKIESEFPELTTTVLAVKTREKIFFASKPSSHSVASPLKATSVYKGLQGPSAVELRDLHSLLKHNIHAGIARLEAGIYRKTLELKLKYFPVSLVLNNAFYSFLLDLRFRKEKDVLHGFLMSLPRDLFMGLSGLVVNPTEVNQIQLVRILNKLKDLLLCSVITLNQQLKEQTKDYQVTLNMFLNILYLCAENFPNEIREFLEDPEFSRVILEQLKILFCYNDHLCAHEGELLLRLLFIHTDLRNQSQAISQPSCASFLLQDITMQRVTLSGARADYVAKLFSVEFLLETKNIALIGYFLRSSFYTERLNTNQLLALASVNNVLQYSLILYPSNAKKFAMSELYKLEIRSSLNPLITRVPTEPKESERQLDQPSPIKKSSTTLILRELQTEPGIKLHDLNDTSCEEEEHLSLQLISNPLLSFLKDPNIIQALLSIHQKRPYISRLSLLQEIIYMVTDAQDSLDMYFERFARKLPLDQVDILKIEHLREWQAKFDRNKLIEHESVVIASELEGAPEREAPPSREEAIQVPKMSS